MEIRFRGAHEIELAGHVEGDARAPAVLLLHGGGQTRHSWSGTALRLAEVGFRAIALDLRGHGDSGWAGPRGYRIDDFAADLRAVISELGGAPALVGASLGGLTSLIAAGEAPRCPCSALVLVDVAPRLDSAGRDRIGEFMRAKPEGFTSLEEAADAIAAFLPHRPRPRSTEGLAKNLRRQPDGRWRWHWDPAFMGGGLEDSANDVLRFETAARTLTVPTLLVRGGISDVVSVEGVRAFLEVLPTAESVDVADAGHMVAGDQNDPFTAAVQAFLMRSLGPGRETAGRAAAASA